MTSSEDSKKTLPEAAFLSQETMQNREGLQADGDRESIIPVPKSEYDDWLTFPDDDVTQQQSTFGREEAEKIPFVGDKARTSSLSY